MYQGDRIPVKFPATGRADYNLDDIDFVVYFHIAGCPSITAALDKSDFTRQGDGSWLGYIESETTRAMAEGGYVVEFHDLTHERIFKSNIIAFEILRSASALEEE